MKKRIEVKTATCACKDVSPAAALDKLLPEEHVAVSQVFGATCALVMQDLEPLAEPMAQPQ